MKVNSINKKPASAASDFHREFGDDQQSSAGTAAGAIGYLVPEFPGQTHTFFWREIRAFDRGNVPIDIVSSRLPIAAIAAHEWTAEAKERTTYLHPPQNIARTILHLLSRPRGIFKCLRSVATAECDGLKMRVRLLLMIFYAGELSRLALTRKWIHLHCHMCSDIANLALLANQLSGIPYSLTLHGPLSEFGPNQEQKWSAATFAIVITHQLLGEAREVLGSSMPERVEVVPMGVDIHDFRRQIPYVPYENTGPLMIFSCGRLNPCKGHATIIDAVVRLRNEGIDVQLKIAGEDELGGRGYRVQLEQKIEQSGVASAVTLLGAIPESRVRDLIEEAHFFVLASRSEPFGIAIAEAMAMETPTIATAAGGVCEWVDDGKDCVLVPPDSADAIAEVIVDLSQDPERCVELGKQGRRTVVTKYGSHRSAEVLLKAIGLEHWRLAKTSDDDIQAAIEENTDSMSETRTNS